MRRMVALVAAATVLASIPALSTSTPAAEAKHVIDQGCVHFRETWGPAGAFVIDAFLRCKNTTVRRKPIVARGTDGPCKTMVPHHRVHWPLWAVPIPFTHSVSRLAPC
jgi:hypothetical protein